MGVTGITDHDRLELAAMNRPVSMRPSFVGVGPGRSGTSWLHQLLLGHPEICMSVVKETEYFNTHYAEGPEWYDRHFPASDNALAVGEISNNYYLDSAAIERIHAFNPRMKIIMGLRHPADLLASMYIFGLRRGLKLGSIEQALHHPLGAIMGSGYDERLRRGCTTPSDDATLLEASLLDGPVETLLEHFPREQVYLLAFERLAREPGTVAEEVFGFLGVDPRHRPTTTEKVINQSVTPRSRTVANIVHRGAFLARKLRFHRLLGAVHRSETVRMLLFKQARDETARARKGLKRGTLARLEMEAEKLKARLPVLRELW